METNHYSLLGLYRDNGKQSGHYCGILGLYRHNGKRQWKLQGCLNEGGRNVSQLTKPRLSEAGQTMEEQMETTVTIESWGYIGIMEKKMETTVVCWGYVKIIEKNMETTIVCWGHIRIMEKKMEATIL